METFSFVSFFLSLFSLRKKVGVNFEIVLWNWASKCAHKWRKQAGLRGRIVLGWFCKCVLAECLTMLPIMNVSAASHFSPLLPLKLSRCYCALRMCLCRIGRMLAKPVCLLPPLAPIDINWKPPYRKKWISIIPNSPSSVYLRICFPLITAGGAAVLSLASIGCTLCCAIC